MRIEGDSDMKEYYQRLSEQFLLSFTRIFNKRAVVSALCFVAMIALCCCLKTVDAAGYAGEQEISSGVRTGTQMQLNSYYEAYDTEPYVVRTILKEYASVDPNTGTGFYGRYTELQVEGNAPNTLRNAVAECNKRAEEAVKVRAEQTEKSTFAFQTSKLSVSDEYRYVTYGYIATVTRADQTAFSILETEFEKGIGQHESEITYHFYGLTCDTKSGEEITLTDLLGDDESFLSMQLREALKTKYGVEGLATTEPGDYAWIGDVLGIRFYFNSDAVSKDKREEINDYTARAVNVSFPYGAFTGQKTQAMSVAPESYIAMIDREIEYDLPYGNLSVKLLKKDDSLFIRIQPRKGDADELRIEYADDLSDFYIMRAEGGLYLFRERIGYQEGFFYDFSNRDGGFGRFAYNTAQYFYSFLREILVALPYNPYCVHMAEVRRSIGESTYGKGSFIPHGHYTFPSNPTARYKRFVLTDDSLQIDMNNMACRLLEDFTAMQIDDEGNEIGEVTIPAGRTLIFESVAGEASRYADPPQRSSVNNAFYDCRLTDGTLIRFESNTMSTLAVEGAYINRFTEPISLGEAQFEETPEPAEVFTVRIGGKDYPLIPDYSKKDHTGEEIDFGEDVWWSVEGYPGRYVCTDEDLEDMKEAYFADYSLFDADEKPLLEISEDGHVALTYLGQVFTGDLPQKRFYKTYVYVLMESETQRRTFQIVLREGKDHSTPTRIELFSEGEPATNEPSKVPPLLIYLTHVQKSVFLSLFK